MLGKDLLPSVKLETLQIAIYAKLPLLLEHENRKEHNRTIPLDVLSMFLVFYIVEPLYN